MPVVAAKGKKRIATPIGRLVPPSSLPSTRLDFDAHCASIDFPYRDMLFFKEKRERKAASAALAEPPRGVMATIFAPSKRERENRPLSFDGDEHRNGNAADDDRVPHTFLFLLF